MGVTLAAITAAPALAKCNVAPKGALFFSMRPTTSPCALSVVVACTEAARSIEACLGSLDVACAGVDAEVIVLDASRDETADRAQRVHKNARVVRFPPGTLTPQLWANGYAASRGRVVAFTTGHCIASPSWARAMLDGIEAGATGVGGPFDLAPGTSLTDWAVFYLRYSVFLQATPGRGAVPEIAGDNAAYRRDALDRHAASFGEGFWEVDFHRRVHAEGGTLALVPDAAVRFGRSFPFAAIFRQRFAHGRHFGAGRVAAGERTAWQVVLAAPLVPFVLVRRIAARVLPHPRHRRRFVLALPVSLALAVAWSAGEAWGALTGAGVRPVSAPGVAT
jgi:hypothetical protein